MKSRQDIVMLLQEARVRLGDTAFPSLAARIDMAMREEPTIREIQAGRYTLQRINSITAFLASDEGGEGIVSIPMPPIGMPMPMIAADEMRIRELLPEAEEIAQRTGIKILMVKFTNREEIRAVGS